MGFVTNERNSYPMNIIVNGRQIDEVVIDSHYKQKHPDITDALILELVVGLDGKEFQVQDRECLFLGVINCFRR